jgi:hypothetical protein
MPAQTEIRPGKTGKSPRKVKFARAKRISSAQERRQPAQSGFSARKPDFARAEPAGVRARRKTAAQGDFLPRTADFGLASPANARADCRRAGASRKPAGADWRTCDANFFRPFAWRQNQPASAPAARQKAAYGETVGINAQTNPAPARLRFTSTRQAGAKEFSAGDFLPPHRGLNFLNDQLTVSPWAFVRHSVTENRHIPI